jgi:hypothetical protein
MDIRTGVGRRRRWTVQEKGRIVAEALTAGVNETSKIDSNNTNPKRIRRILSIPPWLTA